jgi:hypothetical protein
MPESCSLGSEVWLSDGSAIRAFQLQANGEYLQQASSRALPFFQIKELETFLGQWGSTDETTWIRGFRDWARTLKPQG